ncbi:MAG TPA: lysylphosphatidylglycerol synthase transmembrane domain-containing protein [Patescibacteria group bacterium]|nr:lysylphosphatidylglycerol synthase transmembrane domain-containing protein [Patescibacteria group bacterium]
MTLSEGVSKLKSIVGSKVFQVFVSIALLLIVFRSVHIVDVLIKLRAIPLTTNILYITLVLFVILLTSIRWQFLLTQSVTPSQVFPFFAASMMGLFYNLFLPSMNGGDAMKWTLLPPLPHSKKRVMFSVLHDRVVGLAGLILVGLICGLASSFFFKVQLSIEMIIGLSILSFGSLAVIWLLTNPHVLSSNTYVRQLPKVEAIGNFLYNRRKETFVGLLFTFVSQFLFFTGMWIIAVPLGFSVPLWQMILFGSLAFVFASLPLSFSGFGTTELAFLYFFQPLGIQRENILALTTTLVIYKFLFAGLGWIVGSYYQAFHLVTPEK